MAVDLTKFIARFIEESGEHIKSINAGLLTLDKAPDDVDTLQAVYRSVHTLKGAARMIKLQAITQVAHKLEDALDALIRNEARHSKAFSELLFRGVDTIADLIDKLSAGDTQTAVPADICEALELAARGDSVKAPCQADVKIPSPDKPRPAQTTREASESSGSYTKAPQAPKTAPKNKQIAAPETIRVRTKKLDELIKLMGEITLVHKRLKLKLFDIREVETLAKHNLDLIAFIDDQAPSLNGHKEKMLQIARSLNDRLRQLAADIREEATSQEILTGRLQDRSIEMRMLPLDTIFDTFHRTVRDLARSYGKEIEFEVHGGETELDKKIVDQIGDALLHMVRNAIDHGIEHPDERQKAGKNRSAIIRLAARYEGGNVAIVLGDDGRGISPAKIKSRALSTNMMTESELNKMTDSEIVNLIFHSGFSTSEIITDISGRGVGMDVVRQVIVERFKGSVRIDTKEGKGTTFRITLPLTMAIMHVLVVTASGYTFAFGAHSIVEILRVPKTEMITVVDKQAVRLRDQIIPVVYLHDVLNLPAEPQEPQELLILIAVMGTEALGMVVDSMLNQEDMVIKPLPAHMQAIAWVSGVIISEKVGLITVLHFPEILETAKQLKIKVPLKSKTAKEKTINILVVDDSISTREIEKSVLESYGYNVRLAGDGLEALEKAKTYKYDLLIVDIEMPRMNGFSLTEKLRQDEIYQDVPIILVSSLDKPEDINRGIQVGANAYIIKGAFDESNLIETIQNIIG